MKDSYKLVAVQMEIRNKKYPHDLLNDMKKLILEASSKNADVIVFPDYMDLNLLPYYMSGSDYNLTDSVSSLNEAIVRIFESKNFFAKELIFTELINLARKYNIFICSGGWLGMENRRYKKSIALISPYDGIVFEGESTHLFPWEYELNFILGESLLFCKDVLGSVGTLVGGEIYFPEVSRIFNLIGVKILLTSNITKYFYLPNDKIKSKLLSSSNIFKSTYNESKYKSLQEKNKSKPYYDELKYSSLQKENISKFSRNKCKNEYLITPNKYKISSFNPYNDFKYRCGIWREVQQNQIFACESFLLGNLGNDKLEGRASIIGPCEITDDSSGIIAKASSFDKEETVIAEVKLSELDNIRKKYPIKKFLNPDLYKKYLPNLYEKTD